MTGTVTVVFILLLLIKASANGALQAVWKTAFAP